MVIAINELLDQGAVRICSPCSNQFLSPYFLVQKANGNNRFILNLKKLNTFLQPPHFKMEDIRTVSRLIKQDWVLSTIDLKNAYFLIPVHKNFTKYLRFQFEGHLFEFVCMPFGLCTAPFVFTKLIKPILHLLRSKGFVCVNYLDDFLLLSETFEQRKSDTAFTVQLLHSLGFIINDEKSLLKPKSICKFLGFVFNTQSMRIELPFKKRQKIFVMLQNIRSAATLRIRTLAQFLGLLCSVCPAVKKGWLYTKQLERDKFLALQMHHNNYDARMSISSLSLQDFSWWSSNIWSGDNNIRSDTYDLEIFTHSSLTGWGTTCNGQTTNGWWSLHHKHEHINFLELMAIFYALKFFVTDRAAISILIRCDNTTALSYIDRIGSIQYPKLCHLACQIWTWCETRDLFVYAAYISSLDNVVTDIESRKLPTESDISLSLSTFELVCQNFGTPDIRKHKV
mgnify:FL=1